jgi:hypothetical protein
MPPPLKQKHKKLPATVPWRGPGLPKLPPHRNNSSLKRRLKREGNAWSIISSYYDGPRNRTAPNPKRIPIEKYEKWYLKRMMFFLLRPDVAYAYWTLCWWRQLYCLQRAKQRTGNWTKAVRCHTEDCTECVRYSALKTGNIYCHWCSQFQCSICGEDLCDDYSEYDYTCYYGRCLLCDDQLHFLACRYYTREVLYVNEERHSLMRRTGRRRQIRVKKAPTYGVRLCGGARVFAKWERAFSDLNT